MKRKVVFDVNEFYDSKDPIGFLSNEPQVFKFLSKTSAETVTFADSTDLPSLHWIITLGDNKK